MQTENTNGLKIILSPVTKNTYDVYTDYRPAHHNKFINVITMNQGIRYIHQLQNIFIDITGEEFEVITLETQKQHE